jgi:hypothetical protein
LGQAEKPRWILLGPDAAKQTITLRPNVAQPVQLVVQNPTMRNEEVVVKLAKVNPDGTPGEGLAESAPLSVSAGNSRVTVKFAKPGPMAPGGQPAAGQPGGGQPAAGQPAAGQPAAAAPGLIQLEGPPFKVHVQVLNKEQKELESREVPITVLTPAEYVDVTGIAYKPADGLMVQVRAKEGFTDPPCAVELMLVPEHIPGLIPAKKAGAFKQVIKKGNQEVTLVAKDLKFQGGVAPQNGLVFLNVDGYPRAFAFRTDFARGDSALVTPDQKRFKEPAVRFGGEKYLVPADKATVLLEVDAPPATEVALELGADRDKNNEFDPDTNEVVPLPGPRAQRLFFGPTGPGGTLLFKPDVTDWKVELDTAGIFGKLPLRVRMLDGRGATVIAVTGELVFDDTPPENVRFASQAEFPQRLVVGEPLPVKATASDPESQIREVAFFVGKPVDGKVPPKVETVKGEPSGDREPVWWSAQLPLAVDKKGGTVDVSVQATNGAGQTTIETIKIQLVEPGAAGAGAAASAGRTVKGKVVQGDRAQPGVEVVLKDDKGMVKATAKTGTKGKELGTFAFKNVPPGTYTVSASQTEAKTKGEAPVTVEADKDPPEVEISLYR